MSIEQQLSEMTGRKHVVCLGHGTTAVCLTLEWLAAKFGPGEVILPALLCPSVAQVVIYAGFRPRFADVRRDDFTMEASSVASLINSQTRAIIPVHLFGHTADIAAIKRAARHVFILEDVAQSLGARRRDALGDAALLSFGGNKVVDAGGGALATDDDNLAEFARRRKLPPYKIDTLLQFSHRNFYHGLMDLSRSRPEARVGAAMRGAIDGYRSLYYHCFPDDASERLSRCLYDVPKKLCARQERAEATHRELKKFPSLQLTHAWAESGVCWRYSFLAENPEVCLRLTAALRKGKIHASNHYFSLARLFDDAELPNAEFVCRRIINLWVDEEVTDEYLARTVTILEKELS